jgi:proliferating cell nuclear antigen PCNA
MSTDINDESFDPSKDNQYLFYVTTIHTNTIKMAFEIIGNCISETPMTISRGDKKTINDSSSSIAQSPTEKTIVSSSDKKFSKKKKGEDEDVVVTPSKNKEEVPSGKKKKGEKNAVTQDLVNQGDEEETLLAANESSKSDKSSGGIRIMRITEDCNVLIDATIEASKCNTFYCRDQKYTIGIDLKTLNDFLKSIKNTSVLTFYMVETETNTLYIRATSSEENNKTIYMEIKLIDVTEQRIKINDMFFDRLLIINSNELHQTCKDSAIVSNKIEISSVNGNFSLAAKSDSGRQVINFPCKNEKGTKMKARNKEDVITQTFELKYLSIFSKCQSLCPYIRLYMKADKPLVLKIQLASLGHMYVFITPVDDDDK